MEGNVRMRTNENAEKEGATHGGVAENRRAGGGPEKRGQTHSSSFNYGAMAARSGKKEARPPRKSNFRSSARSLPPA